MKDQRILARLFLLLWLISLPASLAHAKSLALPGIKLDLLASFDDANKTAYGQQIFDPPVFGPDGNLYGTAFSGGSNGLGVVFKVTPSGTETTLYTFTTNNAAPNGKNPSSALVFGPDGALYGVASSGGSTNADGTIFKVTTNGVFTLLYTFGLVTNDAGFSADGSTPFGGLTLGRDGMFYGITSAGGISNAGTVFQFSTNSGLTTLHSFTGDDGNAPEEAPLVEGADGVFYGTTIKGGTNNLGTIFSITSSGNFTNLYQFSGIDGNAPYNGLAIGADGSLYGTTIQGGNGSGTIFRLTPDGVITNLFQFNGVNGQSPQSGVLIGPNNVLFGTTDTGTTTTNQFGTVFLLATNGQLTTLYSFSSNDDGARPASPVIRDAAGNLYSSTVNGGKHGQFGTIFKLTDTFKPTNAITAPVANQRWSNSLFVVRGSTRANVGVNSVSYSLNGPDQAILSSTNDWASWESTVTLAPGTNVVQIYAVDNFGHSATNTVKVIYITGFSTALLNVLTNGSGSISPVFADSALLLGTNYSMTAKPAVGSAFVQWTDGSNNVVSTSNTLNFTMVTNLTLIANFVDVAPPTLAITSPKSGLKTSNDVFTVTGTVKDNLGVSNVMYSLNGADYTNATLSAEASNWTAQVTLSAGSNSIAVFATDTSGNISPTNTVLLDHIPSAPLVVNVIGSGTLKPDLSGSLLALSNSYTMTATAAKGFAFYFWNSGGVMTTNPSLTFTMVTNLTNTVTFQDVTAPTVEITSPTHNQKVTNSFMTVIGKASDNVAVTNVSLQINGGNWTNTPANGRFPNFFFFNMPVQVGTNILKAVSTDSDGNLSATNVVTFIGIQPPDWAPNSLTNSTVLVDLRTTNFLTVSLGSDTFSQTDTNASGDSGVGNFLYAKGATNFADLYLTFLAPPDLINTNPPQDIQLTFTSPNSGTFLDTNSLNTGTFAVTSAPAALLPSNWSGHAITAHHASDTNTTKISFSNGGNVTIQKSNESTAATGTFVATAYSPATAMIVVTYNGADVGKTAYLQVTFNSKSAGSYEVNTIDSLVDPPTTDTDFGGCTFK